MRKVTVLLMVVVLALPAAAQEKKKGKGFGGFGGGRTGAAMLLNNADVQKELNMTEAQKEAVKALGEEMRKMFSPDLSMEERQELLKKMQTEGEKIVKELKDEQKTRLKQIQLQQVGLNAFINTEVGKGVGLTEDELNKVKLSAEQKEKLQEIQQQQTREMRELFQGGGFNDPDTQKKLQALRKEFNDKQINVLEDEQKKAYKDLTGKPFEGNLLGGFGAGGFGKKKKDKKEPN